MDQINVWRFKTEFQTTNWPDLYLFVVENKEKP